MLKTQFHFDCESLMCGVEGVLLDPLFSRMNLRRSIRVATPVMTFFSVALPVDEKHFCDATTKTKGSLSNIFDNSLNGVFNVT
jgi:hypothetical protein